MFERELRDVAFIKRWSIVRTIRDQSVAEHSWFVAMYANDICTFLQLPDDVKLGCLRYALWHDVDEIFTGDIPGPSKRKLLENPEALSKWKLIVSKWTQAVFPGMADRQSVKIDKRSHNDMIHLIVKTADWIDAAMEMATEAGMGNRNCLTHMYSQLEKAIASVDTLCVHVTGKSIGDMVMNTLDPRYPFQKLAFDIKDGVECAYIDDSKGPQIAKLSL